MNTFKQLFQNLVNFIPYFRRNMKKSKKFLRYRENDALQELCLNRLTL